MKSLIKVNENDVRWVEGMTLSELQTRYKPKADITVYNGFPVTDDIEVQPGDTVSFIRRGEKPGPEEMKRLLVARHSPQIYEKVNQRTIGIAGVGGLGSSLAIALARLSVGTLVLADFDIVEPSNLNRQQYLISQIGSLKVNALKDNLGAINPYLKIEIHAVKIDGSNIKEVFGDCDVIAECFDNPESKSELVEFVLKHLTAPIVAVSGIAGYQDVEKLLCRKLFDRLYVIGDGVTAAAPGMGLMAPKVGVAAHLQANKILELLLEMG